MNNCQIDNECSQHKHHKCQFLFIFVFAQLWKTFNAPLMRDASCSYAIIRAGSCSRPQCDWGSRLQAAIIVILLVVCRCVCFVCVCVLCWRCEKAWIDNIKNYTCDARKIKVKFTRCIFVVSLYYLQMACLLSQSSIRRFVARQPKTCLSMRVQFTQTHKFVRYKVITNIRCHINKRSNCSISDALITEVPRNWLIWWNQDDDWF